MASCAGASSISANGCGTSFGSASPNRRSAASYARCAIASCRRARDITVRPTAPSRNLKKVPRDACKHRPRAGPRCRRDRSLVRRRNSPRPEEQEHAPLGKTRHAALCSPGPPHRIGLYFRCDLSGPGKSRRADPAMVQYRGDEPPTRRDLGQVTPGRHAALLLDQAGWHTTPQLTVPSNISIVPLPAKCPELNAQENVWQFLRENWLSNRIFTCYDNLVDHCCHAWNKLVAQPWTVMSIGLRDWAHGF